MKIFIHVTESSARKVIQKFEKNPQQNNRCLSRPKDESSSQGSPLLFKTPAEAKHSEGNFEALWIDFTPSACAVVCAVKEV